MLKSVKAAQARYEQSQSERAKVKKSSDKDLKRKIVTNELAEVERKKLRLQESTVDLIKDADKLAFETEQKHNIKPLSSSNDLRKIAAAKETEIKELDEMAQSLILRRDSIM